MITVYLNNTTGKILRPSPFVSIAFNARRNKADSLGGDYSITLIGTILASGGSPFQNGGLNDRLQSTSVACSKTENPYKLNSTKPNEVTLFTDPGIGLLKKKEAIRHLFGRDGQKVEIQSTDGAYPSIIFYPNIDSINFEDDSYANLCRYTITLSTPILYNKEGKPLSQSIQLSRNHNANIDGKYGFNSSDWTLPSGLIEDYNETWAVEVDNSYFLKTPTAVDGTRSIPRCYRVTRNASATGKVHYKWNGTGGVQRYEAWENARDFIKEHVIINKCNDPTEKSTEFFPQLSSGTYGWELLSLNNQYAGFNHVRTENIDKTAGSYSVVDTWLFASGNTNTIESYNISANSSVGSPFTNITLNGKIKGLYKDDETLDKVTNVLTILESFKRAKVEYERLRLGSEDITNPATAVLATGSILYKRASSMTALKLNPEPVSTSVNFNKSLGEIDYTITYDNRPTTIFNNVLAENITITDTYPGDIYAMMPTLNTTTGPLFQYIGGVTQYERTLNVDLSMSHEGLGTDDAKKLNGKGWLMKSPSKNPLINGPLLTLVNQCCPLAEPNIRKCVVNPINETWEPKTGRYTLSISWTYELNPIP